MKSAEVVRSHPIGHDLDSWPHVTARKGEKYSLTVITTYPVKFGGFILKEEGIF